MIQRPQSLTMALAAILLTVSIFTPIWQKTTETGVLTIGSINYSLTLAGENSAGGWTIAAAVFAFIGIALCFTAIFSYKNRSAQVKINLLNIIFLLGSFGSNLFWFYQLKNSFAPEINGTFGLGFYLAPLALLMLNISNHLIRRDENLVRDADRLR
jgi:hypothetical protein